MANGTVSYSVGQLARLAGVTVRTLHHYDEIGLLSPRGRSEARYRLYEESDLARLQQILFYRELGFALEEITSIVDDPRTDAIGHLRRQRGLLIDRMERLSAMVAAINAEMEAQKMGISLTPEERFEVFGNFNPEAFAEEVEQRWGPTEAYRQSARRVAGYTKHDWQQIKRQASSLEQRLASSLGAGAAADGPAAMELAEEHRRHIERWFYDCDHTVHRGLGDMYVADPRFAARYEAISPGLARFIRDAVHANAERAA